MLWYEGITVILTTSPHRNLPVPYKFGSHTLTLLS